MEANGMESKSKPEMQKQKLEVSDILIETVTIYFTNLNIIIYTFLISLPFFSLMVYFETLLQETMIETSKILNLPTLSYSYYGSLPDFQIIEFSKKYSLNLIQLVIIYLVPLHLLELFSAVVVVDLASKLRSEETKNGLCIVPILSDVPEGTTKVGIKDVFGNLISISKLRGIFMTSIYVLFFSTSYLFGLLWIVTNYQVFLKNSSFYLFFAVIFSLAFAKLLRVYLEWSAMWNMSIVISVLEGIYGIEALVLSADFNRGCQKRGLFLMLIFFAWGQFLRLSCLYMGGYKEKIGVSTQVGLFCLGNILKWVTCMIYFYDCKQRSLEKKLDEESGRGITNVNE